MMLSIITLVFGLVLLIVGAIGVGSMNSLKGVDKDSTEFKNAKNTHILVLIIGILMFVLAALYLAKDYLISKAKGKLPAGSSLGMKRYYF